MRTVAPGSTTQEQCRCSARPGRQVARLTKSELPVDIFVGQHDQTASPTLSRAYFDVIDAPVKGFYLFEYSAHTRHSVQPVGATSPMLHRSPKTWLPTASTACIRNGRQSLGRPKRGSCAEA